MSFGSLEANEDVLFDIFIWLWAALKQEAGGRIGKADAMGAAIT